LQTLSIKNSRDLRYFIGLESLKTVYSEEFEKINQRLSIRDYGFFKIDIIKQIIDPTKIVELEIGYFSEESQIILSKFTNLLSLTVVRNFERKNSISRLEMKSLKSLCLSFKYDDLDPIIVCNICNDCR
jgi:hypothetical protein